MMTRMHIHEALVARFIELDVVEASVEVVAKFPPQGQSTRIRIDALRNVSTGEYSTTAYREEHVKMQPEYPQTTGAYDARPEVFSIWVKYDLPWTNGKSADEVINSALGFLEARVES